MGEWAIVILPRGISQQRIDRARKIAWRVALYLLLAAGAALFLMPVVWLLLISLKSGAEARAWPPTLFPKQLMWQNYANLFRGFALGTGWGCGLPRWLLNTAIIGVIAEAGGLLANSLVAFSFARLRWRLREPLFILTLATMFLPGQVTMVPTYLLFSQAFHWNNTWFPQLVPAMFATASAVFLLRQYMLGIPVEIDESARLDGCGDLALYWRVILPMCKPALGAVAIFLFSAIWNDMFTPLLYIRKCELWNVAMGVGVGRSLNTAFVAAIPPILLFVIFQKRYIQGIVVSGVKG